jgi:hypothetical protein
MIDYSNKTLWGVSGGQLEYVAQCTETRQREDKSYYQVMVIRFTDHDVYWRENEKLIEGKYYELEFPLYG